MQVSCLQEPEQKKWLLWEREKMVMSRAGLRMEVKLRMREHAGENQVGKSWQMVRSKLGVESR